VELRDFKRGVALMSTRPFGEQFAEELLCRRYGLNRVNSSHDLEQHGMRVECKFSRIFAPVSGETLLERILSAGDKRFGSRSGRFAANFQKLHPGEFDRLFYGIVFDEGILLHAAGVDELVLSNQHLNNRTMKQFSITQRTLASHEPFRVEMLSWEDVLETLRG
jgi:hypothetical protein